MLAPADTPTNSTTPGSSSDALVSSRSPSRVPQKASYQVDDLSRASENVASSPQYVNDGHSVPSTHTTGSPYSRTPSMRHPHVEPSDYSPSVSHPQAYSPSVNQTQAYSPALVSPSLASNYIPPPSPTPSHHSQAYPVPLAYNKAYPTADGTYQQQQYAYQQDPYHQPYQQQPYPEPTLRSYPEPTLVDPIAKKVDQVSTISKPVNNGRRKKIIWIGAILTVILIGVAIGLIVSFKNKDNDDSSLGEGGRVTAPPLPNPMPEKNKCPDFFCHNYFWETCVETCKKDSVYKSCKKECKGEFFCEKNCEKGEKCFEDCSTNLGACSSVCFAR